MDARVGEVRPKAKMTKAARIRMAWWNTIYFNFGLFSMLEAPGIVSMTYSPLSRIIKMKYTNKPYETHKPLYVLNEVSYMLIVIGFISLVGILFLNVDGLPRDSATYLDLRAGLVGAIVIAPLSLALVYFTPSEYVGPVTISAILVVVILAASYVKVRRVHTGRQTRRQRRV
ncbi:hypothetical protein Tco_0564686 [Tanacetum coccineum]